MSKTRYYGLWERELNGGISWSGKATINGVEGWVNLYTNKSDHPESPTFDFCFKPIEQAAKDATQKLQKERMPF